MTTKFNNTLTKSIKDKFNEALKAGKIELRGNMLYLKTETKHGSMIIDDDEQRAMYDKGWEDCLAAQKKIKDALIPHGYIVIDSNGDFMDANESYDDCVGYIETADNDNNEEFDIRPFRFIK